MAPFSLARRCHQNLFFRQSLTRAQTRDWTVFFFGFPQTLRSCFLKKKCPSIYLTSNGCELCTACDGKTLLVCPLICFLWFSMFLIPQENLFNCHYQDKWSQSFWNLVAFLLPLIPPAKNPFWYYFVVPLACDWVLFLNRLSLRNSAQMG